MKPPAAGPGDDPRLFRIAVDAVAELVRDAPKVSVHYHTGRSHSPVVVAVYLMRALKLGAAPA